MRYAVWAVWAVWAVLAVGGAWALWLTVHDLGLLIVLSFMWGSFVTVPCLLLWTWLSGRSAE